MNGVATEYFLCLIILACGVQSETYSTLQICRVQLRCFFCFAHRFFSAALNLQQLRVPVVSLCGIGIQCNAALIFLFRAYLFAGL